MKRIYLLWLGLAGVLHGEDTYRQWTDIQNRQVEAAMLGIEGDQVRLKLRNGTVALVPLSRFSEADQAFAKSAGGGSPSAAETAPSGKAPSAGAGSLPTAFTGKLANPPADKEWPRTISLEEAPEVVTVKEDAATKEFVYRSPHYEFRCDTRLSVNVVREFGRIFEATYLVNCKLPLDIKPAPEPLRQSFLATLYTTKDDYIKNGGLPGSAGVYRRGEKALSAPLSSLGVKILGSRVALDYNDADNRTLIHEITHQMMNHWLRKIPTWMIEGSADYVALADYERGKFSFSQLDKALARYVSRRGMQAGEVNMLKPDYLMALDNKTWNAALANREASINYASAGLLVTYFYRLDGEKDGANMIAFMRAVEGGKDYKEATAEHLLRGRDYAQLEKDVAAALKKEGLMVTFVAGSGSASAGAN